MDWNNIATGLLSLVGGGAVIKLWEEWRKMRTDRAAERRTDRTVDYERERQEKIDSIALLNKLLDEHKDEYRKDRDRWETDVKLLRDSEQTCRAENATLSGRLLLVEGREREKTQRIRRLEKRLVKLTGDPGSWNEEDDKPKTADGGQANAPDTAG